MGRSGRRFESGRPVMRQRAERVSCRASSDQERADSNPDQYVAPGRTRRRLGGRALRHGNGPGRPNRLGRSALELQSLLQAGHESRGRQRTLGGIFGHAPQQSRLELRRQRRVIDMRRGRCGKGMLKGQRVGIVRVKGHAPGEQLIGHDRQTVDIAGRHGLTLRLLRSHVGRRAQIGAGFR